MYTHVILFIFCYSLQTIDINLKIENDLEIFEHTKKANNAARDFLLINSQSNRFLLKLVEVNRSFEQIQT